MRCNLVAADTNNQRDVFVWYRDTNQIVRTIVTDTHSGDITIYVHDGEGRMVSVTDAAGGAVQRDCDEWGNITSFVDRRSGSYLQVFDEAGNLLSATGPDGTTATNTWYRECPEDSGQKLMMVLVALVWVPIAYWASPRRGDAQVTFDAFEPIRSRRVVELGAFARNEFIQLWANGHHNHDFPHLWAAAPPGAQAQLVGAELDRVEETE